MKIPMRAFSSCFGERIEPQQAGAGVQQGGHLIRCTAAEATCSVGEHSGCKAGEELLLGQSKILKEALHPVLQFSLFAFRGLTQYTPMNLKRCQVGEVITAASPADAVEINNSDDRIILVNEKLIAMQVTVNDLPW